MLLCSDVERCPRRLPLSRITPHGSEGAARHRTRDSARRPVSSEIRSSSKAPVPASQANPPLHLFPSPRAHLWRLVCASRSSPEIMSCVPAGPVVAKTVVVPVPLNSPSRAGRGQFRGATTGILTLCPVSLCG